MKYLRTMDHHKYIFLRATLNRVRILLRRNFLLWETMLWVSFFEFRISLEWIWIDLNCLIDEDVEVDGVYEGSRKKKRMKDRRRKGGGKWRYRWSKWCRLIETEAKLHDIARSRRPARTTSGEDSNWCQKEEVLSILYLCRWYDIRLSWPCTFYSWFEKKSLMFYHMVCKEHLRYLYNRFRIRRFGWIRLSTLVD